MNSKMYFIFLLTYSSPPPYNLLPDWRKPPGESIVPGVCCFKGDRENEMGLFPVTTLRVGN